MVLYHHYNEVHKEIFSIDQMKTSTYLESIFFPFVPKIKSEKSRKSYQKPAESCPECGISQRNLKLHIRKVHDYEKQKCSVCGKELKNIYFTPSKWSYLLGNRRGFNSKKYTNGCIISCFYF